MIFKRLLTVVLSATVFTACNNTGTDAKTGDSTTSPVSGKSETSTGDAYFTFTVDGKNLSIPAADVSSSFNPYDSSFKINAGQYQELGVVLTIPNFPACPCSVAAGGPVGTSLDQGSVSLQNYPEKKLTFNSWYNGLKGTPPADAIKITDLGTLKDGYRYITGEFHVKVLKTESNGTSAANKDYEITNGKFRVKHDTHGSTTF